MNITFFLAGVKDLEVLRGVDPDQDWREFQNGETIWILQTYLRLARSGYPVELATSAPAEGIVVFHANQAQALQPRWRLLRQRHSSRGAGRQTAALIADFEVVQNGASRTEAEFLVPHTGRNRAPTATFLAAKSPSAIALREYENLHPEFLSPDWREFLAARGIEWEVDSCRSWTLRPTTWESTGRTIAGWI